MYLDCPENFHSQRWQAVIAIAVSVIAIFQILLGIVTIATMWRALDSGAEFKRGLLQGRSEAHQFIRGRISPEMAGKFYQWLAEKSKTNGF